ncbi:alpha/beta hydrolase family protein [Faucicola boevrei]|uniref:hypothetical protein n=1 Tax=Faucicola boevrei TaxID=346665 RepID=UPI0003647D4E|nr:hypothetical protein [Moraxella boevrei]
MSNGKQPNKNRITKLRILIDPIWKIDDLSYEVTYRQFAYSNKAEFVKERTRTFSSSFSPEPKSNYGGRLAYVTDEYNLFTFYDYLKIKEDSSGSREGRVTYNIFQKNKKSNKKILLQTLNADWYYKYENKVSEHKFSLTKGTNGTEDNTQKKQNLGDKPKASFTAFVGGAADKYEFLEPPLNKLVSPTYIMQKCLNNFGSKILNIPTAKTKYYGYEEAYTDYSVGKKYNNKVLDNLLSDIREILKNEPKTQINLVGHSLGGWNVAGLAKELYDKKICTVNCLITLDPVGQLASKAYVPVPGISPTVIRTAIYVFEPKPISKIWVNIYSQPQSNEDDDTIANLGGRWNNDEMKKAKYNYTSQAHHGEAEKMFITKCFENNTLSAADILLREIKKIQ